MKRYKILVRRFELAILLLLFALSFGCKIGPAKPSSLVEEFRERDGNIVFFILDGVRWQEFKGTADQRIPQNPDYDSKHEFIESEFQDKILTNFWAKHAKKGLIFGIDPYNNAIMEVMNHTNLTVPVLSSLFMGKLSRCSSNNCQRIPEQTFLERIKIMRGFDKGQIAAFHFEDEDYFPKVLEKQEGSIHIEKSNNISKNYDRMTFQMAMDYLDNRPRISVIYLSMTDWCGHIKDYRCYIDKLQEYDEYIDRLFQKLETMNDYGEKTTVIMTTDHGRGAYPSSFHGHENYESRHVWLYISGPYIQTNLENNGVAGTDHHIDHGIIRPLMETLMGINPIYPGTQYTDFMDRYIFSRMETGPWIH